MLNEDSGWHILVFHSTENEAMLQEALREEISSGVVQMNWLGIAPFGKLDYNNMLLSEYFWQLFNKPHVLLFEADSIMCGHPTRDLSSFLIYDVTKQVRCC